MANRVGIEILQSAGQNIVINPFSGYYVFVEGWKLIDEKEIVIFMKKAILVDGKNIEDYSGLKYEIGKQRLASIVPLTPKIKKNAIKAIFETKL